MDNKKILLFALITIIVVILIGAGVYVFVFQGVENITINNEDEISQEIKDEKYEELKSNFSTSFSNSVKRSNTIGIEPVTIDASKDVVYTKYELGLSSDDKYQMKINIPYINLPGEEIEKINNEIDDIFGSKVNNVIQSKESLSIYNVDYVAYLNDDMLSLVVRATLKEGEMPQRVIIKTYNYNFERKAQVYLGTLLVRNDLDKLKVEEQIYSLIQEVAETNAGLEASGYVVYKRDINNDMYKLENIDTYFIDQNDNLYIIFAYGNKNYTSELDIEIF